MVGNDLRLVERTIGDKQGPRLHLQQWTYDSARRTSGTENQYVCPLELEAEIHAEVAQKPNTVCIVAVYLTALEGERVNRTGSTGALGDLVDKLHDGSFVRHRDVEALATRALKLAHCRFEFFRRNLQQLVLHMLPGLHREQAMNNRRTTV
jgi:hypothetical protein